MFVRVLNFYHTSFSTLALLLGVLTCITFFATKPAFAACEESYENCNDGCLASVGMSPGSSAARDYCSKHGGLGPYVCGSDYGPMCYDPPPPPPSCSTYSTSSTQSCGGAWQTGTVTTTTTHNADCTTSTSSSDTCGCYSGYTWNGSTCAPNPPPPPPSCSAYSTSSTQSCGGAWQTGTVTTVTTHNSDCTTSTSSSDSCGCYSGYTWNGSTCAPNPPPPPPSCSAYSTSSTQSCGGAWQTGTVTTTTTHNADCTTSTSSSDTCGCYSGYSWNGSSCVANVQPENGSCGAGVYTCNTGSLSGTGQDSSEYYWNCNGSNGGSPQSCSYAKPPASINGACGGSTYSCSSGSQSGAGENSYEYYWNCNGSNGGASIGCSQAKPPQPENGSCGSSTNSCNSGSFSDSSDTSTNYQWSCNGISGGSSTGCSQAKPGQCGSANGNQYSSAPRSTSSLCSLGTSSAVSGSGPWAWTCSAAGGVANCSSSYCSPPVAGACDNSVLNGCSTGNLADLADNSAYYQWQCTGLYGGADSPVCQKAKPPIQNGSCGSSLNSCAAGTLGNSVENTTSFTWQCAGSNGGSTVNCSQAKTGEPCTVNGKKSVDVYFLADNTNSMAYANATIFDKSQDILGKLRGSDPRFTDLDINFAVGRYLGDPSEGQQKMCLDTDEIRIVSQGGAQGCVRGGQIVQPQNVDSYELFQPMTSDINATKTAFGRWRAFLGGDAPEGQFYAMKQLATGGAGWRPNAGHILIWMGDASGHEETVTVNQALQYLKNTNISVIAMPVDRVGAGTETLNKNNQATIIAGNTNGLVIPFTGSSDDVANKILAAVDATADKICPATPVNGSCGSSTDTCASGTYNDITDSSTNYRWQCLGSSGGSGVNCAEAIPVEEPEPPSCTPSSSTSNQSCPGGWQTGSVTVTTTTHADCSTSQSSSDTCGCNSGYSWNGSSCAPNAPSCTPSSSTSNQSCPGGWQTGSVTVTTTTHADCSTSQSSSDTCGCNSGYSWNGSSCAPNAPSCTPSSSTSNQSCPGGWQTGSVTVTTTTHADCSTSQSSSDTCGCNSGYSWNGSSCVANGPPHDPGCQPDGYYGPGQLVWDGWLGSGPIWCEQEGECPDGNGDNSCCSAATSTQGWVRTMCNY